MFNEKYISVNREDLIAHSRALYEYKRYKFYWNFTLDIKYLNLYRNAYKKFLIEQSIIIAKFLKDIDFTNYYID